MYNKADDWTPSSSFTHSIRLHSLEVVSTQVTQNRLAKRTSFGAQKYQTTFSDSDVSIACLKSTVSLASTVAWSSGNCC